MQRQKIHLVFVEAGADKILQKKAPRVSKFDNCIEGLFIPLVSVVYRMG
jgi:hypothetical protein